MKKEMIVVFLALAAFSIFLIFVFPRVSPPSTPEGLFVQDARQMAFDEGEPSSSLSEATRYHAEWKAATYHLTDGTLDTIQEWLSVSLLNRHGFAWISVFAIYEDGRKDMLYPGAELVERADLYDGTFAKIVFLPPDKEPRFLRIELTDGWATRQHVEIAYEDIL